MIKLSEFEVNDKNVTLVIDRFKNSEYPRLKKLYQYYSADNEILSRVQEAGKPNNKLACAYAKYITKLQTGYFAGVPVKLKSSEEEYLQKYNEVMEDNFSTDVNFEMAKSASIFGYGVELVYQNEKAGTKFKKLDPREVVLIFGTSMDEFLLCGIRYYTVSGLDGKSKEIAEVYTDNGKRYFERDYGKSKFVEIAEKEEGNIFGEVPFILYKNNEEMKSDFEDVIRLNDSYDTAQSNTANDTDYFNDAYMVIEGSNDIADDTDDEDGNVAGGVSAAEKMKKNKILFFPDGGGAKFLVKDINDAATENYKNRLNGDIHKFSMTPDLGDEKFAGNLSGIAIKFKTIPLEEAATEKENKFRVGLKKRCELVTAMLNLKFNRNWDYRDITEEFTRNLPVNEQELTNTVLSLAEYVSHRTLLELLPQVADVDEELKRIQGEKDEYDKLDYSFQEGTTGDGIDG